MKWTHHIVDTNSGEKLTEVDATGWDYQTVANGVGEDTCSLKLRGSGIAQPAWRELLRPWDRTIVHSLDGFAMYAGLIKGPSRWNPGTGIRTIKSVEVRAMAARRYLFMVPTYTAETKHFVTRITGKSPRGIMRRLVEIGFHAIPGDNWHMPIVLGADFAGTAKLEEPWSNFSRIEDLMRQVQDADGGPDVYFDPTRPTSGASSPTRPRPPASRSSDRAG